MCLSITKSFGNMKDCKSSILQWNIYIKEKKKTASEQNKIWVWIQPHKFEGDLLWDKGHVI